MEPSAAQASAAQDKAIWLDRFIRRVSELVPETDPTLAWRDGEAIFDAAAGMSPVEAADIWISTPLPEPGDLGESDFAGSWPAGGSMAEIVRRP